MENKPKFVAIHSSSGHKQALQEILADPAIQSRLADTKYAKEVRALDEFFTMLNNDPDRAYYGWDHVRKANEIGAIGTLVCPILHESINGIVGHGRALSIG